MDSKIILIFTIVSYVAALNIQNIFPHNFITQSWRKTQSISMFSHNRFQGVLQKTSISMTSEVSEETAKKVNDIIAMDPVVVENSSDPSKIEDESVTAIDSPTDSSSTAANTVIGLHDVGEPTPGKVFEAKVISSKSFGIFVNITGGLNVLLPKYRLSPYQFDKLTAMASSSSQETFRIEILSVTSENKLNGKCLDLIPSVALLKDVNIEKTLFNATVVTAQEFGVIAALDENGIQGLVPSRTIPAALKENIRQSFPIGSKVVVQVVNYNIEANKVTFTLKEAMSSINNSVLAAIPANQWVQGMVNTVNSSGIFIRPAGYDISAPLKQFNIPKELLSILRKKTDGFEALRLANKNRTESELVFSAGDVLKVRVEPDRSGTALEFTMMPPKKMEEDDDMADDEDEDRDDEDEEEEDDDLIVDTFDPEDNVLWWRGNPYVKSSVATEEDLETIETETAVLGESSDVVEGSWRRMFEIGLMDLEFDETSTLLEEDIKEVEEEIGELNGLDGDVDDNADTNVLTSKIGFGNFISMSALPADWKAHLEFVKSQEEKNSKTISKLRTGNPGDRTDFESLLSEVERELDIAESGRSKPPPLPVVPVEEPQIIISEETSPV